MAHFTYQTSDRDRVCRICEEKIARNTWSVMLQDLKVSPKKVNVFFHEGCFFRSLEHAKENRNVTN